MIDFQVGSSGITNSRADSPLDYQVPENDPICLRNDGDRWEREAYDEFISQEYPAYEKYWESRVLPLRIKRGEFRMHSNSSLPAGFEEKDVLCAQLSYSAFRHLYRVFVIKKTAQEIDYDQFSEAIVKLVSALDCVAEIQARKNSKLELPTFSSNTSRILKELGAATEKNFTYLRSYRNSVIHGSIVPGIETPRTEFLPTLEMPKIGLHEKYLDWRRVYDREPKNEDFARAGDILKDSYDKVIKRCSSVLMALL